MLPSIGEPSSKSRHPLDRQGRQPVRWLRSTIALLVVAVFPVVGMAENVKAVAPEGAGVLTKCRNWLVTRSCRTYHHISLPSRVAVGDTITLSFGSSPKEYGFPVARIALEGDRCVIFSEVDGDRPRRDEIKVAPCYRAEEGR
jgi:hypothetical protein